MSLLDELIPVNALDWPDYLVCAVLMLLSVSIGIYYAFCANGAKEHSSREFLLAGKNMSTLPMAMSLFSCFVSAVSVLGFAGEVYKYGTMGWVITFTYFLVMPATAFLYLPIFYRLQLTSALEYLEKRFNRTVRLMCSGFVISQMCVYAAVVSYATSLALNQMTSINVYILAGSIFMVCIFYSAMGGMRAVIFTNALQMLIMFGSILAIVIKGTIDSGGIEVIFQKSYQSDRIEFLNFDPDPRTRNTVWSLIFGSYCQWTFAYAVHQSNVQRYLTVPTISHARNALWLNIIAFIIINTLCSYIGLIIYAKYADCDPLQTGLVSKPAQLMPLFVLETLGSIPGVPGLFIAGILSAGISSVTSGLSALSTITLEDFIKPLATGLADTTATNVSKGLAALYGITCFGFVFMIANLTNILEIAITVNSTIGGPILGIYSLGMFCPWSNAKGAGAGVFLSTGLVMWIAFGSQTAKVGGLLPDITKTLSISGCNSTDIFNTTMSSVKSQEPLEIYKLSYLWYSGIGCVVAMTVGMLVSWITGFQNPRKLNPDLILNFGDTFTWCLPASAQEFMRFHVGDEYEVTLAKIEGKQLQLVCE